MWSLHQRLPEGKCEALASGSSSVDEALPALGFHESVAPQSPAQGLTHGPQAVGVHCVELNRTVVHQSLFVK